MPGRFVILHHDHPWHHWDLLLETGPAADTWRLLRQPCPGEPIAAEPLPPHRLHYFDYEGPVSGGHGMVRRCWAGTWSEAPSVFLDPVTPECMWAPVATGNGSLEFRLQHLPFASRLLIAHAADGRCFVRFLP